ncbi:MAG: ribosome maturation factor RimP [Cyclobacteriaceae bacterium]|nr:ribosome maturation factor RimP [Cyclobacteriaceae bacterium]
MDLHNEISKLVEQYIDDDGVFMVEVNIKGKPGNLKIQVFIDGDDLLDVEACSKVSRKLTSELEEKEMIDGRYVVEVSSPGVDKPLKFLRQYQKHIGRELEVHTQNGQKHQGVLLSVASDTIELSVKSGKVKKEIKSETLKLPFGEIEKATVVLRF